MKMLLLRVVIDENDLQGLFNPSYCRVISPGSWRDISPTTPAPPSIIQLQRQIQQGSGSSNDYDHAGLSRHGERVGQKRLFQKKSSLSASDQVTNAQCQQVCQKELSQDQYSTYFLLSSEQKAYLEKMKQERLVKEELMSQDDEEDIPVTEREMNLKVTISPSAILALTNFSDFEEVVNLIFLNKYSSSLFQGLTSNWDLDMFREAQARASKVSYLINQPNTTYFEP